MKAKKAYTLYVDEATGEPFIFKNGKKLVALDAKHVWKFIYVYFKTDLEFSDSRKKILKFKKQPILWLELLDAIKIK